ncbi:MAG: cytochrome c oxidase assembly protein [Actinomycetota bacterium]|nr:cytochrome c oxidase assembly protein [Actinomycetota bacterium]
MSPFAPHIWLEVWNWPFELQVMLPLAAAVAAYHRGGPGEGSGPSAVQKWRTAAFYGAIALLIVAIESPMDTFSSRSFAWHMVQHMLLLLAVPPLGLAAQPWGRMWAGVPEPVRGNIAQALARVTGSSPRRSERIRAGARSLLGNSKLLLALFAAYLWSMHLPVFFDAALRSQTVHDFEHLGYLAVGTLYWSRAVPSAPFPERLAPGPRIVYLLSGLLACWVLGIALTFAPSPLYAPYLHVVGATYAGVMSSQVTGGAIMWAPSMIPFDILFAISVQGWLADSARADEESSAAARAAGLAGADAGPINSRIGSEAARTAAGAEAAWEL